jgi:hypothetical protein
MRYAHKLYLREHGLPALLSAPLGLAAAYALDVALNLPFRFAEFLAAQSVGFQSSFAQEGMSALAASVALACGLAVPFFMACLVAGLARRPWALRLLRAGYVVVYLLALYGAYAVFRATALIFIQDLKVDGLLTDAVQTFYWRVELLTPAFGFAALAAALHVLTYRRVVLNLFSGEREEAPAPGDLLVENLRTHGRDPRFRRSLWASFFTHACIFIIIPLLARFSGCVDPYLVPQGSGNPVVSIVAVVKPKKKPKKKYILNPNSVISFHIPDLDDSELLKEVEEQTQVTYQADPSAVHGKLGAGGGKKGGWPDGMGKGLVRFIRLEFKGPGWDDGMGPADRADLNFLEEFNRVTGFPVTRNPESHPIAKLAKYDKGYAPPFVFMTGEGAINVSRSEIEILRRYLLDGGMLFADAGSPEFDRSFRNFMSALFPGEPMLVIPDDDPIFQYPYSFPNGAPPLWHHGGWRALGIKRGTRWAVFYHPGDINDAWKTGHSGVSPSIAKNSMNLGINIVYHAFTHYLELTRKYRKK